MVKELRELERAATPGPWRESGRDVDHDKFVAEGKNPGDVVGLGCEIDGPPEAWLRGQFGKHADAALIAAARNALPLLLDVVEIAHELLHDTSDDADWEALAEALHALEPDVEAVPA